MDFCITESVVTTAPPARVWKRLLEPDSITGFLGVAQDIRPYRPEGAGSAEAETLLGHSFRIVGLGGGLYHAAFDEIDEPTHLAYAVWRDDTPEAICLLSYRLRAEADGTAVEANVSMDMPIEEIFGLYGTMLMPVVEPMAKGFAAHRLRQHLRALLHSAG